MSKKKIGILNPVDSVPPEFITLYGDQFCLVSETVDVKSLSIEGYENAERNVSDALDKLTDKKVDVISMMGTSLSFFKGRKYNEFLEKSLTEQTGLPSITMTTAIIKGLTKVKANRISVLTAYSSEVTQKLINILNEYNFSTVNYDYLNRTMEDIQNTKEDELIAIARKLVLKENTDTLLISCGGLRTLKVINVLEAELGISVVSSSVAGAWATVQLAGCSGYSDKGGILLRES